MKNNNNIKTILTWLPSLVISLIYIQNAYEKIVTSNQLDKIVSNKEILIGTGVILLIATALFLYNKTIIWGTSILVLYMTFIVFIHLFKGKPFEVAALMVAGTIFAAYFRKPSIFQDRAKAIKL